MNFERIDLSNNLIHFVSPVNMDSEEYTQSEMHPKEFNLNGDIVEDNKLSPFFILRRIIRNLQILSTWSYRKNERTIYGSYPAVCFTEMPISEFVRTSITRQQHGGKISNYALIFNKRELFLNGARPVIYGTSQNVNVSYNGLIKLIDPPIFDDKELYRYVAFKLDRLPYPIDWTHEREWRWPNFNYEFFPIDWALYAPEMNNPQLEELLRLREESKIDFHGLNINESTLSNIGIILKTNEQAELIIRDILCMIDQKKIQKNTFGFILFFNNLSDNISKLIDFEYIKNEITKGYISIDSYFVIDETLKNKIHIDLKQLCEKYKNQSDFIPPHKGGLSGLSFPCLNDNKDSITRILVDLGYIKITKLGRYLVDLPIINYNDCMENNEIFIKEVINPELEKILNIKLTYYSIGHLQAKEEGRSITIDDVPFYTEPNDDEYNYAHREDDY